MWEHMRKVQEIFNRLGNKSQTIVAQSRLMQVPVQQVDENTNFPTDPAGVKSWLVTHNAFGENDSLHTLKSILEHCNRSPVSSQQRLEIMQQFEKSCARILQELDKQYLYRDFPLHEDSEAALAASIKLCEEMAYGYKLALCESTDNQKSLNINNRAHAISHALEHLSRQALRLSMVYRTWPDSIWQDAIALVQIAQLDRTENLINGTQPLSVIDQYAQLCSFYLLATGNFQINELRALFIDLSNQVSTVTFQTKPDANIDEQFCTVKNRPPTSVQLSQIEKSDKPLYFSLNSLVQDLKAIPEYRESPPTYLKHLNASDQHSPAPALSRDNNINAVTGLSEIHTLMGLMPPANDTEQQYTNPADLIQGNASSTQNIEQLLCQPDTSNVGTGFTAEKQSTDRMELRLCRSGSCQVQVGELIAHYYGESSDKLNWHIGIIDCLKTEENNSLKVGVKSIADHARAVNVCRVRNGKKQSDTSIAGVLSNYKTTSSRAAQLLLPAHSFKLGETVYFSDGTCTRLLRLAEVVSNNNRYQSFAVYTVQNKPQQVYADSSVIAFKQPVAA